MERPSIVRKGTTLSAIRGVAGLVIVSFFVLVAILAPLITSHDPVAQNLPDRRTPSFWLEGGTVSHPLGTDYLGRDVWSRLVYGARTSLIVSLGGLAIGGVLGTALGFISGYWRGSRDKIFDTTLPRLISPGVWLVCCVWVALWLLAYIGPALINLIIVMGLVTCIRYIKPIRLEVMLHTPQHSIAGASDPGNSVRFLFPKMAGALPTLFISQMSFLITLESILSFLGVGVSPPTPSWGGAVADGRVYLAAWWISAFPLICIALLSAGFYMLGSWLTNRRKNSRAAP